MGQSFGARFEYMARAATPFYFDGISVLISNLVAKVIGTVAKKASHFLGRIYKTTTHALTPWDSGPCNKLALKLVYDNDHCPCL